MRFIAWVLLAWIFASPVVGLVSTLPKTEGVIIESTITTEATDSTEEQETIETLPTQETETETTIPEETEPEIVLPQLKPIEEIEKEWATEAEYLAKTVWGEARGISILEQEKVIWCVLNRVDSPRYPDTIKGVVTSGAFHGYYKSNPIWEEHYTLALEVIAKWLCEKEGGEVDRALESDYYYFSASSDGTHHIFRKEF